jgi:UDP:flavonoid glycosyltransferase YjiC (YdhE family)
MAKVDSSNFKTICQTVSNNIFHYFRGSGMLPLLLLLLPLSATSWEILFVNVLVTGSHQTVGAYTANVLADHGHSVTYLSSNVPNYLRSQIKRVTLAETEIIGNELFKTIDDPDFTYRLVLSKIRSVLGLCGTFFRDPFVQHLINTNAKFDAMISAGVLYDSCAFALAHKLKIPGRITHFPAPCTLPAQISAYGLPLYHSSVNHDGLTYQDNEEAKASLLLRAQNILKSAGVMLFMDLVQRFMIEPDIYPHVPDYPGYGAISKEVGLVLMHYHPLVDFPVPFGPGVVPLAGTLCTEYDPASLSDELREFIDSSEEFIYISFGSLLNNLQDVEKEILIGAFVKMSFKFNVVWKMKFEIPNLPPNVKTFKWVAQTTLLRHPKLRVFITHGGYASKVEAMCAGAPMLVIPQFAFDQYLNAEQIWKRQLGDKIVSLRDSNVEEVYGKVMNISGPKIRGNSKVLQRQLLLTRTTEDQLLGFIDMAISGKKLLPGYQPFYEYFYIDIILLPILTIYLVKYLVKKIRRLPPLQ